MSSLITTVQHAFAKAAQDIVSAAKFIETNVLPALKKVQAAEPTVEAITSLVDPQAVGIERIAFALIGEAIAAMEAAGNATAAGGLNLTLDSALVTDLKAIYSTIKTKAAPATASVAKV